MPELIKRELYLKKITPYMGKPIIKVFTGQRRVGKSYLMLQTIDQVPHQNPDCNIIYINKEKHEFDHIRDYHDLLNHISEKSVDGQNAVFIDEIQDIDQFEKALRSLYNEPGYDLYCTGSNADMLSGELATYLSGRYVEIEVHALTYREFLLFHQMENNSNSLSIYLRIGGLPNLIHLRQEDEIIFDYLRNIYATILFKDVIRRYNIRNVSFLENLVLFLSDNVGSIVSAKKISDFLKSQQIKISPNAVMDYLSYLCNAYFISKTRRQDLAGKKIFEIGEKYFFEDTGLRNSIAGYKAGDIGKVLENAVYAHLRSSGYTIHVGVSGSREVDFVAERLGEKVYVQVCYLLQDQTTVDREFGNLLAIKDNYPKFVVSMDEVFGKNTYQGIRHMHIRDFLYSTEFSSTGEVAHP
ncbi:MAG: ATP-binding protein [Bacteroidota bacterium]